eukprot:TRINITY_DN15724_c0_g1_i2.p2 TRINITY_DN15724_c0_g1~~TRINITY_DN15724_c0_g1_i2.p2  ORF type:complete len:147 (+),score=72.68 TRINITY_DN15724_c0_g1_i2:46-441(+)
MSARIRSNTRLAPEVNRILYVRNLPFSIKNEDMFEIFGKFGPIRQIRMGSKPETKGSAFVVFDDIFDAKNACDKLSGYNVMGRYLIVVYYQKDKSDKRSEVRKRMEEVQKLRMKYTTPARPDTDPLGAEAE